MISVPKTSFCCFFWLVVVAASAVALSSSSSSSGKAHRRRVSIVTGANGYVGREVVNVLLNNRGEDAVGKSNDQFDNNDDDEILCLVRSNHLESETKFWKRFRSSSSFSSPKESTIKILPYDMLDGGKTFEDALNVALDGSGSGDGSEDVDICVYHIASVFGPTKHHIQTARDNVKGVKDLVETLGKFSESHRCRLVVTSSMAAVRGSGQDPKNGEYYTHHDWNTVSTLEDNNWGSSYQWSKAESEKVAWELSKELDIPMTTICPSFVFGPPTTTNASDLSNSFSITLFGKWVRGEAPVQSRLFVDVRDVARAHVAAGNTPSAAGQRFIASAEARVPSGELAEILKDVCLKDPTLGGHPEKISFDADFKGGSIPIGDREVEAQDRLKDVLGITMTPVHETIRGMARTLLLAGNEEREPSQR